MKKYPLTLLLSCLLWSACSKYETQYEGPFTDEEVGLSEENADFEIVYVQEGKIKLLDRLLFFSKTMESDFGIVVSASINYSHDKIAYRALGRDIKIIDMEGNELDIVPNSQSVEWFDWHHNNETLCMLQNRKLTFHGPDTAPAITNLDEFFPFGTFNRSVDVAVPGNNSTVIFNYRYEGSNLSSFHGLAIKTDNSQDTYHFPLPIGVQANYLRVSEDGNMAILGVKYFGDDEVWSFNISTAIDAVLADGELAAISPENNDVVIWDKNDEEIYSRSAPSLKHDIGTKQIYTIDW